jgi:DNA ligase-1
LREVVERFVLPLGRTDDATTKRILREAWGLLGAQERFIYHKLIGGAFRVGVQRRLVAKALAAVAGIDVDVMEHRLSGEFDPTAESFSRVLAPQTYEDDASKPYPFYLANQLNDAPTVLGDVRDWQVEWKWDGIRAQLIRREGGDRVLVWSRGEELITDQFPELGRIGRALARDAVLDGEVLAWDDRAPAAPGAAPGREPDWLLRGRARPFASLQTRLGRKGVQPTLFDETDSRAGSEGCTLNAARGAPVDAGGSAGGRRSRHAGAAVAGPGGAFVGGCGEAARAGRAIRGGGADAQAPAIGVRGGEDARRHIARRRWRGLVEVEGGPA